MSFGSGRIEGSAVPSNIIILIRTECLFAKASKLHIVFHSILDLDFVTETQKRFRDRLLAVYEAWAAMPNSPIAAYLKNKEEREKRAAEQKAQQERKAQEKAAALEAARQLAEQERVAEIERLRRKTVAPPLTVDILTKILTEAVTHYTNIRNDWKEAWRSDYFEDRRLLYRAALVSRQWNTAASRILYRGRIHIGEWIPIHLSHLYINPT